LDFAKDFSISEALYSEFIVYAKDKGVSTLLDGAQASAPEIKRRMKAYIARNIWGNEGFYPIWNEGDRVIYEVIQ
jgi:carboxyl-terminal processing protease